jgi:beta-lactamase class A
MQHDQQPAPPRPEGADPIPPAPDGATTPDTSRRRIGQAAAVVLLVAALVGSFVALAQIGSARWQGNTPLQTPTQTTPAKVKRTPIARATAAVEGMALLAPEGLDALSPDLASYVAAQPGTMGVVVYDLTRNRAYAYNATTTFTVASSAKVYILCAYLDMLERQHRAPNATERAQMTQMIEQSDNNAAQALYNRIGQASGQARYLASIGITDYVGSGFDWGYGQLSPADMVRVLMLLQTGQILTEDDREFAFSLMGHVDLGRWGVGDTAPAGAQVYMKDGWVTGPDDKWAQNSSGIVVADDETYVISVYSAHLPRYDWSKIQHVCGTVAKLLASAR